MLAAGRPEVRGRLCSLHSFVSEVIEKLCFLVRTDSQKGSLTRRKLNNCPKLKHSKWICYSWIQFKSIITIPLQTNAGFRRILLNIHENHNCKSGDKKLFLDPAGTAPLYFAQISNNRAGAGHRIRKSCSMLVVGSSYNSFSFTKLHSQEVHLVNLLINLFLMFFHMSS